MDNYKLIGAKGLTLKIKLSEDNNLNIYNIFKLLYYHHQLNKIQNVLWIKKLYSKLFTLYNKSNKYKLNR